VIQMFMHQITAYVHNVTVLNQTNSDGLAAIVKVRLPYSEYHQRRPP